MTGCYDLIEILARFAVRSNDTLLLEAPLLAADTLDGGFANLTGVLRDFLAPGLLVVPVCSPSQGRPKPTFDPHLSPSEVGPFSEFFRTQPGVVRSHSPSHSLAALGTDAQSLLEGHRTALGRPSPWGDAAFGKSSPWDLLVERNAHWVVVGDAWEQSCFFDYLSAVFSEQKSGLTKKTPFVRFDRKTLAGEFRARSLLKEAVWGEHPLAAFKLKELLEAALALLDKRPLELRPDPETKTWLTTVKRIKKDGYLKVGTAKRVITPPVPCRRWDGKPLEGVYRDLHCRVVVTSCSSGEIALVLCDLLGLRKGLADRMRRKASALSGIPVEAIQIACTHAHSTPDTAAAGFENPAYLDTLVETVASAVAEAAANRQAGRMGWSRVPIRGIAASRRVKLKDGSVFTTRYGVPSTWRVDPKLVAGSGEIDPELVVIRFENLDGKVLAAVSNFGCHPSVALASRLISGDFVGESMAALERVLGDAVVLCTNGAGADVDPTLEMPFWGPRDETSAVRLGNLLAAQILECLERTEVSELATVAAVSRAVDLEVRPDWTTLLREDKERMKQEFAGATPSPAALKLLTEQVIHTQVQALRLGDLTLLGLPGEVFAGTSLRLKSMVSPHSLAVVQLANDDIGYLAPKEAFEEGGYEVGVHFWGRITPEGENVLVAEALEAAREAGTARPVEA